MYIFFIEPLTSSYGWSELAVKAGPLISDCLGAGGWISSQIIQISVLKVRVHHRAQFLAVVLRFYFMTKSAGGFSR